MKSLLDDQEYLNRLDPNGMLQAITDFPQSARKAVETIEKNNFNINGADFDSILVAGMGGSAVGGLLLRDWLFDFLPIQITVNRGYHLPAWVDKKTLIFAVSYSGNTEETLSQYHEAFEKGCTVICFCSGGLLEAKANENHQILVKFPAGHQPRAAIPYQFFSLAGVMHKLGFIDEAKWEEVDESIMIVEAHCSEMKPEVPLELNPGKKLLTLLRIHNRELQ